MKRLSNFIKDLINGKTEYYLDDKFPKQTFINFINNIGEKIMKITEMNRTNAKLVREILNEKLPSILKEYGLSFELGNARFDDDGVKFTGFKLSVKGALSESEKALRDELQTRDSMEWKMLDQK